MPCLRFRSVLVEISKPSKSNVRSMASPSVHSILVGTPSTNIVSEGLLHTASASSLPRVSAAARATETVIHDVDLAVMSNSLYCRIRGHRDGVKSVGCAGRLIHMHNETAAKHRAGHDSRLSARNARTCHLQQVPTCCVPYPYVSSIFLDARAPSSTGMKPYLSTHCLSPLR